MSTPRNIVKPAPQVVLHLGPPKTATTSLQLWYGENEALGYHYVGVYQPRPDVSLVTKALKLVRRKDVSLEELHELRYEVEELVASKGPLVFSEEMFLLYTPGVSLSLMLARLGIVFERLQTRVVFCVRDVEKVLFSFYQELYESLESKAQDDFKAFVESSYCDCYRYQALYSSILEAGFNDVGVLFFDDLVAGRVRAEECCPIPWDSSTHVTLLRSNITNDKRPGGVGFRRGPLRRWVRRRLGTVPFWLRQLPGARTLGLWILKGTKRTIIPQVLEADVISAYEQDVSALRGLSSTPPDSRPV